MQNKLLCGFLFFSVSALAQIPSEPLASKEDSVKAIREHRPGQGFTLVEKKDGNLIFSAFATTRYLNQSGLDDQYTDYFGRTRNIKKRNDLQFQKVMLYFKGWLFVPKFRYMFYVWTANTSLGQGAQVVVAGNLQYQINKHLDVGIGVGGLPGTRSLLGQWPAWNRQDARPMAEEFFRPSFTTGVWAQGEIAQGFYYKAMLGNNLSQLGIDANQIDNKFDTWSGALWWSHKEYGRFGGYGDFEGHRQLTGTLGVSYTSSNENRQSQPDSEDPENSQIRLSDGTGLFSLNAFGNGTNITDARYQMAAFHGGMKFHGVSFDAEYFTRRINKLVTTGPLPVSSLTDNGFALQASAMAIKKTLQGYVVYSKVNGEYGKPSEWNIGLNIFPFKTRVFRINAEYINTKNSPVGYTSFPTVVGANGSTFMLNLELFY